MSRHHHRARCSTPRPKCRSADPLNRRRGRHGIEDAVSAIERVLTVRS